MKWSDLYHEKNKILLSLIVILLLVLLVFFKDIKINRKVMTLDEIKQKLLNTEEIYICKDNIDYDVVCRGDNILRIEKNKDVIKEFIDITLTLDDSDFTMAKMKDRMMLFFMDAHKKIIVSAEFGYNFILKTKTKDYILSPEHNAKLRELLNLGF